MKGAKEEVGNELSCSSVICLDHKENILNEFK